MKPTFRQKSRYQFERFINKGGSSIFKSLIVVFIFGFLLIIGLRYLLLAFFPELDYLQSFWDHIWVTFLEMTAPGNMNQDNASPVWLKITAILAGFTGVILLSMLIAFITSWLNSQLHTFRKGRGKVFEEEHTVILGWNERVIDIIRELIIANESEKRACIVVLADREKEHIDDLLTKRLPNTKTTVVITTSGNPSNINELRRINITSAKSVILLAKCSENASFEEKIASDIQAIKSIIAIKSCQNDENSIPIISEIFTPQKRKIIEFFNDKNIIALDSWNIMGKLMTQTSLTSGLQLVYNEILSFDGCEIYFYNANWSDMNFFELAYHFEDGIPLGVYRENGELILRPTEDLTLQPSDEIIILAEDDSSIKYNPKPLYQSVSFPKSNLKLEQKIISTLILGWHDVAEILISEASDYLLPGSHFDIVYHKPSVNLKTKVESLQKSSPELSLSLLDNNPMDAEQLTALEPEKYDHLIILSQDTEDHDADKVDSDTLIILLLLRSMMKENFSPKILTQVLNSENQELIHQTDVDDFIISNRLITSILAQLSEEPRIKLLYDDLFSEDGSEIYVKPAHLYFEQFPIELKFMDAMYAANQREEICLGIRKNDKMKNPNSNFGVRLNLPKDESIVLTKDDYLVVLSEDEL
jgi:hypothetical protein